MSEPSFARLSAEELQAECGAVLPAKEVLSVPLLDLNAAINLGFSELLKSVLRQSPDVIMIGEVRDAETADIAVRAANSGHLVLATIHAPVAAGAIQSMRALGVHPHFLSTALRGIVSQRLVRTLCTHCKVSFDLGEILGDPV